MTPDIVCFSHLRWNFVYQRPQHLMTGLSKIHRVFYIEEPCYDAQETSHHCIIRQADNIFVIVPHLPAGLSAGENADCMKEVVDAVLRSNEIKNYILWYYSPMMIRFSDHLDPLLTIYDCMDELSAFLFAPPELKANEQALLQSADLVFTGGHSLYQAKKMMHHNIHLFPSSIDRQHFAAARMFPVDPADQQAISGPRFGFYGVIDERLNIEMLRTLAEQRPEWQFILIGPVVKIDPASLPQRENIHYLGPKSYSQLPQYLGGWTIAIMPFSLNKSTEFISPTKTPEYLAGGIPVISPSIRDVVDAYGRPGLVHIADTPEAFIAVAENLLTRGESAGWLARVDDYLSTMSWETTVRDMQVLITQAISQKRMASQNKSKSYV